MDLIFDLLRFLHTFANLAHFGLIVGTIGFTILSILFIYRRLVPDGRSTEGVFLEEFSVRDRAPDPRPEFDNNFSTHPTLAETPSLSIEGDGSPNGAVASASIPTKIEFRTSSKGEES